MCPRFFFPATYTMRSSAYASECVWLLPSLKENAFRISVVNMLNKMGELTVPCCRPSLITKDSVEVLQPSQVMKDLFEIISHIMWISQGGNSFLCSLNSRPLSQTESKAFSRSISTAPT